MLTSRQKTILLVGLLAGLAIRIALLPSEPTLDMGQYIDWGMRTLDEGLVKAFRGIYFPIQYQIFAMCVAASRLFGADIELILKLSNLLFDVGIMALLWVILQRFSITPLAVLWYWLHPWFLGIFAFGYVDSHFVFFIVLVPFLLLRGTTIASYLVAGVALAIAFLMKPQAQILIVAVAAFVLFGWRRWKTWRSALLLVPVLLLYVTYSFYFGFSLFESLGIQAFTELAFHYLSIGYVMPVFTAGMPNMWFAVAYVLLEPGQTDILKVITDKSAMLPYMTFGAVATVGLVTWYAMRISTTPTERNASSSIWQLFFVASLVLPFVMTSAHENHFFLGSVLLLPILATARSRTMIAAHGLLALLWINLVLLYGTGEMMAPLRSYYTLEVRLVVSVGATILFFVLFHSAFRSVRHLHVEHSS